jgi:hypothetical protein
MLPTSKIIKPLVALSLAFVVVACGGKNSTPNVEPIQDMMESPALKEQDEDPTDPNNRGMKVPPDHTVGIGKHPYKYIGQPEKAEKELKNPFSGNSPEVIALGKAKFEIYCMLCHGPTGHGDGQIGAKMALKPPSLMSDKVRAFKDGRIFHIITEGQGVMGSYASQIVKSDDRWAIVNYIRMMQQTDKK